MSIELVNIDTKGRQRSLTVYFWEKSKFGFLNPKTGFAFWGANQKTDHESIKYKLRMDSSDQIQIWSFEIHNLSDFFLGGGGGVEKKHF